MNTTAWNLDPNGIVSGLGLHDGYFFGIVVDRDDVVKLMVRSNNKNYYNIYLENVGSMNALNFWGGDIIGDVWLLPIEKAPEHMLRSLFKDRITEDEEIAKAIVKDARRYLFVLDSSYGAEVYATCDGIEIVAAKNEPTRNEPPRQP